MNLQYLKDFCILARYEHYTKAAEELGIAQSSLSHAISSLEKELGVYLFEKQGRNVRLTKQGRQYLDYAERALDLLEQGNRLLAGSAAYEGKILNIGFVSSVQSQVISWIKSYQNTGKDQCHFIMYENSTEILMQNLDNSILDVVFSSEPENSAKCDTIPLLRQQIIVLVPLRHPLAKKNIIEPTDLNQEAVLMHTEDTGMRAIIDNLFAYHHIAPRIAGEASEDRVLAQEVSAELGVALMTDDPAIYPSDVKAIPLDSPLNYRDIYQSVFKSHYPSKELTGFLSHVQKSIHTENRL